jgi:hypothetical protein
MTDNAGTGGQRWSGRRRGTGGRLLGDRIESLDVSLPDMVLRRLDEEVRHGDAVKTGILGRSRSAVSGRNRL